MKAFVRRVCRVFLIIGIAGLLALVGGTTTVLGHPSIAHADPACPNGYHKTDPDSDSDFDSCTPNAAYYCPSGQIWSPKDNNCISEASNPNICNPPLTKQDPDNAQQCIPFNQPCGSASVYNSSGVVCIVAAPESLL